MRTTRRFVVPIMFVLVIATIAFSSWTTSNAGCISQQRLNRELVLIAQANKQAAARAAARASVDNGQKRTLDLGAYRSAVALADALQRGEAGCPGFL